MLTNVCCISAVRCQMPRVTLIVGKRLTDNDLRFPDDAVQTANKRTVP